MTKKSLIIAIAAIASMFAAGSASAQNSKFEGIYVGGYLAYSNIGVEYDVAGITLADETLDGFGGGGLIGFGGTNWDGRLYGSLEANVGYDGASWSQSVAVAGVGAASFDVETQLTFGISGRIGTVVAKNFLLYGKLGYARTNAQAEAQLSVIGVGTATVSDDEWYDGFRFGAGIEGMFANNIGVRAEYTYTIYDAPDVYPGISTDINQHLFLIGAAYYF